METVRRCSNCGSEIKKGAKFCAICGTAAEVKEKRSLFKRNKSLETGRKEDNSGVIGQKIYGVLFVIANVGLGILLSTSIFAVTLLAYTQFYKNIVISENFSGLYDVISVAQSNALCLIIAICVLVALICLTMLIDRKKKKIPLLVIAMSCLLSGSLFLLIKYIGSMGIIELLTSSVEMLAGASMLLLYSILCRRA